MAVVSLVAREALLLQERAQWISGGMGLAQGVGLAVRASRTSGILVPWVFGGSVITFSKTPAV